MAELNHCKDCKFWLAAENRVDFNNIVSFQNDTYIDEWVGDVHHEYLHGDVADKLFGQCKTIDLGRDLTIGEPVPLAVTQDASLYIADLFTQSEFGCAMWEAKDV